MNHDDSESVSDDDESIASDDSMGHQSIGPGRGEDPSLRIVRFAPDNYSQGDELLLCF